MTHTYATLQIPKAAYDQIWRKLRANGYTDVESGEPVDMHGIAVLPETTPETVITPDQESLVIRLRREGDRYMGTQYGVIIDALEYLVRNTPAVVDFGIAKSAAQETQREESR